VIYDSKSYYCIIYVQIIINNILLQLIYFKIFFTDSLRIHPKYKSIVEKEFHSPLAVWLAHAKYRLANKNEN